MATVTINEATYRVIVDFDTHGTIAILPAKGENGEKGDPNTLTIGTVQKGENAAATITGEAPNQVLNLILPKGDKGDTGGKGDTGEKGDPNTLTIGTVQKGENAAATITGEAPNQVLNLTLPKGDKGDTGDKGETGDVGSLFWTTTVAPVAPNYTFTKSDLAGATGETPKVGDIIFYSYYRYNITSVSDTTVLCATRVSIRGATGAASKWYTGTAITGTSTTATIFSGSGISSAVVGDMYLNTDTGNVYRCTVAGAASAAKWVYTTNIKGDTGATGADGYSPQVTLTQVSATVASLSVTSKDATTGQETTQTVTFGGTYTDGNGVSY